MNDDEGFEEQLARITAMATEAGFTIRPKREQPYGWDLVGGDNEVLVYGALEYLEETIELLGRIREAAEPAGFELRRHKQWRGGWELVNPLGEVVETGSLPWIGAQAFFPRIEAATPPPSRRARHTAGGAQPDDAEDD